MADEQQAPASAPVAGVESAGGTLRIRPDTNAETGQPTLQEEADAQARAAETPEAKAAREAAEAAEAAKPPVEEETPEAKAAREAAEADKTANKEPIDLKGTIFEGLAPEMQTKIAPYAQAFAEAGTLTDEQVAQAAKDTGFTEGMVRQFMDGAQADIAKSAAPVYDTFGGEQTFREFQGWSKQAGNLTEAEDRTINKAINGGDFETAAELMKAPMERWKAAGGGPSPRDVTTGPGGAPPGSPPPAGDAYTSWSQVTTDMAKPEYQNDPAFRKQVEQKIARSNSLT